MISAKDREILREVARKNKEIANAPQMAEIMKKWEALGRRECIAPPVRLCFSGFAKEIITPQLKCEGEEARALEWALYYSIAGRDLFNDDTPVPDYFPVRWNTSFNLLKIDRKLTRTNEKNDLAFHIEPVVEDLADDIDKLEVGDFSVDREATKKRFDLIGELFGDILPPKMVGACINGAMSNNLVHLMGMENYYLSMYDYPDELHQVMDNLTSHYERYYDFLENEKLLLPTHGMVGVGQETFSFNNELPNENITKTTECWGFLESQETVSVSDEMFGEFMFPYMKRLASRMGLLSYGCCEPVDVRWQNHLSTLPNLRKLSVTPFNNEEVISDILRGTKIVYYSKPRANDVTNKGPLDEAEIRKYFNTIAKNASGCLLEVTQREVGTIFDDPNRGKRYVELIKESIDDKWKP